jgi:hypothetical protein
MPKKKQAKSTEIRDDILRLSRGKKTKNRIGSRRIAHRLNKTEQEKFEVAIRKGYLQIRGMRTALRNTFCEYQNALGLPGIILEHGVDGDYIHWNPPLLPEEKQSTDDLLPNSLKGNAIQNTTHGFRLGPLSDGTAKCCCLN